MTPYKLENVALEICKSHRLTYRGALGAGSYKEAFLAERDGEQFALKIGFSDHDSLRLQREAQALQSCAHEAIAHLRETFVWVAGDRKYWVALEEYLSHGTLEHRLRDGAIDPQVVRVFASSLADALAHLYPRKIVHRDIKPANILFRRENEAVLTDFGIVRMLDATSLTADYLSVGPGTPLYAAPEQLNNEKHLIDWRTDQFGLALVLAECALGHHPYVVGGKSQRDAVASVATRSTIPAESETQLLALGLGVLAKCLAPWPVARFRTPAALIDGLKED